ncbi:hypothetical protein TRVL_00213 [Trypanosoma vivax]|uniref:Uncharacterized protein n=1 Tax=Trypanosoma vivax (strain Y486) TaxID=1055687 RepID=G0TWT3_TRYVY|nr:hypothetical protein TRVL_00213 [Trypanosoma vivax]CCC48421.1 conserved hypothetical protein [Trypanosoma vivax Y486]
MSKCQPFLENLVTVIDNHIQCISVWHLLRGYYLSYSLAAAVVLFSVSFSLLCPAEDALYQGLLSLFSQSFSVLILAGGMFRATGRKAVQRPKQEEWLLENVKDILQQMVLCAASKRALYLIVVLEAFLRLSDMFYASTCFCAVCIVWMVWLVNGAPLTVVTSIKK